MAKRRDYNPRLAGNYERFARQREMEKCVFCDLRDKYVIAERKGWVLTANIFPYIDGQLLVLPERHLVDYVELTSEDKRVSDFLLKKGMRLLEDRLNIKNFWIILRQGKVAGKTIKHLHWNIMPYIEGLNTWHYQKITISPVKLAAKLRKKTKSART